MEIEKRLALLQYTYAGAISEFVNNYHNLKILDSYVEKRKERQIQSAPALLQQFEIKNIEDVFSKLSEVYGCANWSVEKTYDGYSATATSCKLSCLSKKMGGASPCNGWCLNPMIAMITALCNIDENKILIESTLMNGSCCKLFIKQ